jgi:hypothetical protein
MWRVIIVAVFLMLFIYFLTVVLQAFGILKINDKLGFSWKYLIPFYLWIER